MTLETIENIKIAKAEGLGLNRKKRTTGDWSISFVKSTSELFSTARRNIVSAFKLAQYVSVDMTTPQETVASTLMYYYQEIIKL